MVHLAVDGLREHDTAHVMVFSLLMYMQGIDREPGTVHVMVLSLAYMEGIERLALCM